MQTTPGWYPDPTGLPFQRYWNGFAWTQDTQAMPFPAAGNAGQFSTARMPYAYGPAVSPASQWYQRKGFVITASVLGVLIAFGTIGALAGQSPKNAANAESQTVVTDSAISDSAGPTASIKTRAAARPRTKHHRFKPAPETASKTERSSTAPDDGSWIMPSEVGQVLQDAQDDVQRVSGDPIFFSHSHDLVNDRFQILDSDWKVCTQNVATGTRVSAVAHIDFGVVKLDESCP